MLGSIHLCCRNYQSEKHYLPYYSTIVTLCSRLQHNVEIRFVYSLLQPILSEGKTEVENEEDIKEEMERERTKVSKSLDFSDAQDDGAADDEDTIIGRSFILLSNSLSNPCSLT